MIALGRAGMSVMGNILRTIWPQLVSWGVNRLISSKFGQDYLAPGIQKPIRKAGQFLASRPFQASRTAANAVMSKPAPVAPALPRPIPRSFDQAPLVQSQEQHQQHKYMPIKHRKLISKSYKW